MTTGGIGQDWDIVRGDCAELLCRLPDDTFDSLITDPPAGISFMGKEWDSNKGGRDQWITWLSGVMREALRVCKPGAHGLVWALPRTSHWTMTALENAGWEIRDVVTHLFGTGFPKSRNISKDIDNLAGAERPVIGENPNHRPVSGVEYSGVYAGGNTGAATLTGPATPEARKWEGWGTALKPAAEYWILVRKPLSDTLARNVLALGTGAINIGEGRIDGGRWPAHVAICPDVAKMLDEDCPKSKSRKGKPRWGQSGPGYGMTYTGAEYDDEGGPSRFFYTAKPSTAEREAGLDDLPALTGGQLTNRADDASGLKSPRAGAGRTGGRRNHHPTVKSIALMEWLCRLVTPPGGLVLDPFAGSGSTLIAALRSGFSVVGLEQSDEYCEIARRRIAALGVK